MTNEDRDAKRAQYFEQLAKERDDNIARWNRMTPEQKARWPEAKHGRS